MQMRTQIYLEPAQHAALLKESRRLGLSLAGMIRNLVEEHILKKGRRAPSLMERKTAALSLIGLGESGFADVSERVDEHLSRAIYQDMVKERRGVYKSPVKRKKTTR